MRPERGPDRTRILVGLGLLCALAIALLLLWVLPATGTAPVLNAPF